MNDNNKIVSVIGSNNEKIINKEGACILTTISDEDITSVVEYILGVVFSLLHNIYNSQLFVKNGNWKNYSYNLNFIGRSISDVKIGIIGFGKIGKKLHEKLSLFTKDIIVYNRTDYSDIANQVDLNYLLKISNIIIICLSFNDGTINFINKDKLELLQDNAILINISRGKIINEKDLIEALHSKNITVVLDVVDEEPISEDNELLKFQNVYVTPHIAGLTNNSINKNKENAINNLIEFITNYP